MAKVKGQLMGLLVPLVLLLAVIGIAASLGGLFFGHVRYAPGVWPQH